MRISPCPPNVKSISSSRILPNATTQNRVNRGQLIILLEVNLVLSRFSFPRALNMTEDSFTPMAIPKGEIKKVIGIIAIIGVTPKVPAN